MVICSKRVNICLVLRFVINNSTVRFVGTVSYFKHIAIFAIRFVVDMKVETSDN